MAYKTQTQEIKDKIDDHAEKIKAQDALTKFFTVIVAITLVSTLVGIVGLYINAIYESRAYQVNASEILSLQKEIDNNRQLLNKYEIKMEILKSKYPWIKDAVQ